MLKYLLGRATERSSWLGFIALLTGTGVNISPETSSAVISFGVAAAGLIGIFTKDKKK